MAAPPSHLAGPSITHLGHCSRDKPSYLLIHQFLCSSSSLSKPSTYTANTIPTPQQLMLWIVGRTGHPVLPRLEGCCPPCWYKQRARWEPAPQQGEQGQGWGHGRAGSAVGLHHPAPHHGWLGVCPQQAWSQCLCLVRSSAENVHTQINTMILHS